MSRGEKGPREAVLVGFMGAGKTTVGKMLAKRLDAEFVDVDDLIEKAEGRSIREIFASPGEGAFRKMEKAAIRNVVSVPGRVIAAGGGAFLDEGNRLMLSAYGPVFFLDVSCESVLARLSGDRSRPLLPGEEKGLRELLEARRPFYLLADFTVPTGSRPAREVAEDILALLSGGRHAGREEGGA
ncbi:MAG: shikimate kinase [Deltaproteobacteria bacterium]|nr:shikimate kinase [Deltaproteobacteria bacterium]